MDVIKTNLASLFSGDDTSYTIPVYQRKYSWKPKQCRQLFDDLLSIIRTDREHFFGSVVLCHDKHTTWIVIDGQQRLTTVSLVWLALSKLIKDEIKYSTPTLANNIRNKYCYESETDGSTLPRILHIEEDRKAYLSLVEGNVDKSEADSFITQNFCHFYDWIKESEYTASDFVNAIRKLMMVRIEIELNDKPQLIFDSLNSTGLALTDGDRIRNFILMDLNGEDQKMFYKNYWVDIEQNSNYTGSKKEAQNAVTLFVRDYITSQTTKIPAMRDVYFKFKDYARKKNVDTESLLKEMKKYSRYLFEIENAQTTSSTINVILKRLALLEMTVCHPFEFKIMDDFYIGRLTETDVRDIFVTVESFIFRRLICDVPTNALNKIFASLYDGAWRLSQESSISFVESVQYLLMSKDGSSRFPDDKEFVSALATKNIYKMRAKNKIYTFYRFNAGNSKEGDTSVIDKMQPDANGNIFLSIEHIMPQTLSNEWKHKLGGEQAAERIRKLWGHTIANLTLTAYNSSYSNSSFDKKLNLISDDGQGIGFKYSPLHLNEYIKQQTSWGEGELQERMSMLQQEALDIWKMPCVKFCPTIKEDEELTLCDESVDFTYTTVVNCTLNGETVPLKQGDNWINVFIAILKLLYRDYKSDIKRIANDASLNFLQNEATKFNNSLLIFDGIYAYLKSSTQTKIDILRNIFQELEIDLDDVVFHVRRNKDADK